MIAAKRKTPSTKLKKTMVCKKNTENESESLIKALFCPALLGTRDGYLIDIQGFLNSSKTQPNNIQLLV